MYKIAKNLSPFTLGLVFCCSQAVLSPAAHAASLNPSSSSVDVTLPSDPSAVNQAALDPSAVPSATTQPLGAAVDCALEPNLNPSQGAAAQPGPAASKNSDITPVSKNSGDTSLKYQSSEIASSDLPNAEPASQTAQDATATSPTLIAQAAGAADCCGIGGAATCEVGGVPTGGAGLGGISPLLGLLGLLPAAAIIPAINGGNGNGSEQSVPPVPPAPVPESSSTGAIVAGFGMMGLLLSRRYRSGRKNKNVSPG
ncbi:MAG: hypothetical protein HC852_02350 [Acaryochloridaceae cyanobacterium RU_4_10]|nr:hypothetical protein [Acaryochloridaceae cyanobacterium RU_4_10]